MTFEQWWEKRCPNGLFPNSNVAYGAIENAFKELAMEAWDAAIKSAIESARYVVNDVMQEYQKTLANELKEEIHVLEQ